MDRKPGLAAAVGALCALAILPVTAAAQSGARPVSPTRSGAAPRAAVAAEPKYVVEFEGGVGIT